MSSTEHGSIADVAKRHRFARFIVSDDHGNDVDRDTPVDEVVGTYTHLIVVRCGDTLVNIQALITLGK